MFITAFTSARHLSLSRARSIQSMSSRLTSWRSILILSSHLRLALSCGLFPSGFPTKTMYIYLLYIMRATCLTHLILPDFISRIIFGEEYRSLRTSFCSFFHSSVNSFLLGSNILLTTLFSDNLSLRTPFSVSDHISKPCKITGKIIVLYILVFLDNKL